MARQIRIEQDGAAYHVLARGMHGQATCADDLDLKVWLATLAEACEKTGWRIHAHVMMVVFEDGFTVVAPVHDVAEGTGILDTHLL